MQTGQTQRATVGRWLARKARRCLIWAAVVVPVVIGVRAAVAETFVARTDAVAPEVPRDARVLVFKLGRPAAAGDVVVYRVTDGTDRLGRVVAATAAGVTVGRTGEAATTVPVTRVVGRVVLSTR